jgi:hypothetical protein
MALDQAAAHAGPGQPFGARDEKLVLDSGFE